MTATYPTGAIRDALERAANDPELPASARQRELRTIRDELKHLAGYADSLLGNLSLAEQRDALDRDEEFRLAEDAAIRDEMLRRGLATEDQLDELGLHASAEVAERRADGTLAESVSAADFLAYQHPRGRAGQFVDAPHFEAGPPTPHENKGPGLPDAMPPPQADDPLIAMGLPPDVADGVRGTAPAAVHMMNPGMRRIVITAAGEAAARERGSWDDLRSASRERWNRWRGYDTDRSTWKPPPGLSYSDEVAAIGSPEDAERYLQSRGVTAKLRPRDTEQGRNQRADVDFFRQIAQAVTDAQDRYPQLRDGPHPLGAVAFLSNTDQWTRGDPDDLSDYADVWAATGYALSDPDRNSHMTAIGIGDRDPRQVKASDFEGMKAEVVLMDVNQDGFQTRIAAGGPDSAAGYATLSPYGRMTHELGHAAWAAAGIEDKDFDESGDPFDTAYRMIPNLLPLQAAAAISPYAVSNPSEATAEVFALRNVPLASDELSGRDPGAAAFIDRTAQAINSMAKERTGWELL